MNKAQKTSLLEEVITASGIHQAIDVLGIKLQNYEQSKKVKRQRYKVKQEVGEIRKLLLELENKLEEGVQQASLWEKLE